MKSIIPKQTRQVKERLEAKLDAQVLARLDKYCEYLESDRDYVLNQALSLIFRKDKGFNRWLGQGGNVSTGLASSTPPAPPRKSSESERRGGQ